MPDLAPPRADLQTTDRGVRALPFDDIYFSAEDGLAEARAVFLAGCGLPEGWRRARSFVIGELGFGSGLNLLAAWQAWDEMKPAGATLHFVSIEGRPLDAGQAAALVARIPELELDRGGGAPGAIGQKARALLDAWPARIRGVQRRRLAANVVLTIAHLDVAEALDALELAADAWFLDGFAPARNPDMSSAEVMQAIARRSKPGARLASFTVAGDVRRALAHAGFAVDKRPGFGAKRERLEARYEGPASASVRPDTLPRARGRSLDRVLIIGAGPAGASLALALRDRGVGVTVIDGAREPAGSASGAPVALVTPRLDLDDSPAARLHRAAFLYADAHYDRPELKSASAATDVIQLAKTSDEASRFEALAGSGAMPADMLSRRELKLGGASDLALVHARGRIVSPRELLERALAGCDRVFGRRASRLEQSADGWAALDDAGATIATGDACVIACGMSTLDFEQTGWLELRASRGQATIAPLSGAPPSAPVVFGEYAAPAGPHALIFGATYDPWERADPVAPRAEDDARNLDALAAMLPDLAARVDAGAMRGYAGLRATTPDRLPLVGPVPDADAFRRRFAGLARGDRRCGEAPAELIDGLFVLTGLGSRAFLHAPLLGEALAAEMLGEPGALERGAAQALHPARQLIRTLKRSG